MRIGAVPISQIAIPRYSYADHTLQLQRADLIAYWPLWEPAGTIAQDISGNNRHGTYIGVTLGVPGIGDGRTAAGFPGAAAAINVLLNGGADNGLAAAFPGAAGTLMLWAKVSAAADWEDATARYTASFQDATGVDRVYQRKQTTDFRYALVRRANSADKLVNTNFQTDTGWVQWWLTWSEAADQVIVYKNATLYGAPLTGLAAWSQPITIGLIGALSAVGSSGWKGSIGHVALWGAALSQEKVAANASFFSLAVVTVAAADSSAEAKAMADYVCDGTNDEAEIAAALATPSMPHKVQLFDGTYNVNLDSSVSLPVRSKGILQGQGQNTIIKLVGKTYEADANIIGGTWLYGATVRDLLVTGRRQDGFARVQGVGFAGGSGHLIDGVKVIDTDQHQIAIASHDTIVRRCTTDNVAGATLGNHGVDIDQYGSETTRNVTVEDCDLSNPGGEATKAENADGVTYRNNTIRGRALLDDDDAPDVPTLTNVVVEDNEIQDMLQVADRLGSIAIQRNTFTGYGHVLVHKDGPDVTFADNDFTGAYNDFKDVNGNLVSSGNLGLKASHIRFFTNKTREVAWSSLPYFCPTLAANTLAEAVEAADDGDSIVMLDGVCPAVLDKAGKTLTVHSLARFVVPTADGAAIVPEGVTYLALSSEAAATAIVEVYVDDTTLAAMRADGDNTELDALTMDAAGDWVALSQDTLDACTAHGITEEQYMASRIDIEALL